MSSSVDAHLEINPENEITFTMKASEATPKVTMTLKHPDPDSDPVIFKVKTTQPRRYLVRPNQGLIMPGQQETVQILLVEKDKVQILQSYNSLGDAALAHCKDKFLVQSVTTKETSLDYDHLTNLWTSMPANSVSIANKKLHVRHKVEGSGSSDGADGTPTGIAKRVSTANPSELSKEQLEGEFKSLRDKYDELVAFSVNLTAERDMLNNTLEQTKRELSREISSKGGSAGGGARTQFPKQSSASSSSNVPLLLIIALICIFAGAKLQQAGHLDNIPGLGHEEL